MNSPKLYFESHGIGPPLLLLHGFTGSSASWAMHLPMLMNQFQVILVDIVGHGRSPSPTDVTPYRMEHVAGSVMQIVHALGGGPITLLGYSMGGRLALYIAVHFPEQVQTLILESSSPGLAAAAERNIRRQRDDELAAWIESHGIEAFVNRWEALTLWDSQKQLTLNQRQVLRQQRLLNNPTGLANSLRGMGTGVQPSLWQSLPALKIPTLLVTGGLDSKFVSINKEMASKLPQAVHIIIPGCGHTVHLERPFRFCEAVQRFASRSEMK